MPIFADWRSELRIDLSVLAGYPPPSPHGARAEKLYAQTNNANLSQTYRTCGGLQIRIATVQRKR